MYRFRSPLYHLESYGIGSKLLQRLDIKPRQHTVKHCHSAVVSDWYAHRDNALPGQFVLVDTTCKLCILDNSQVQVGLGHLPQHQLDYSALTITDIIRSEPYWCLDFVPSLTPLLPLCSLPHNTVHSLITVTFSPHLSLSNLYPALFYTTHSCLSCLITPDPSFPTQVPVPLSHSHPHSCDVNYDMEYSVAPPYQDN